MSQNHFNYMHGVPVKIAENFKPPKKLALNQSVAQRLANSSSGTAQLLADCTYDFSLERTVLTKMSEWQHLRQRENCDRKERLRVHQQERQKQLEARQKQMLTAVSYPSTDDLSSDDDGDDSGHGTLSDASKSAISLKTIATAVPIQNVTAKNQQTQQQFSPSNTFDNILVPTVMPDQIGKHQMATKIPSYTKINYSDFEYDTSSPFDNCELKTINDLDILAEAFALNANVVENNKNDGSNVNKSEKTASADKDDNSITNTQVQNEQLNVQQQLSTSQQSPQNVFQLQQYNQEHLLATHHHHQQFNHSNHQANLITNSTQPITNSYYVHQMNYDHQMNTAINQPNYYNSNAINNGPVYACVPNQYQNASNYFNSNYTQSMAMPTSTQLPRTVTNNVDATSFDDDSVVVTKGFKCPKSKWKSVPDIMQEINAELKNSQGKRVRNNSQGKSNKFGFS